MFRLAPEPDALAGVNTGKQGTGIGFAGPAKTSGKWYFEVHVGNTRCNGSNGFGVGSFDLLNFELSPPGCYFLWSGKIFCAESVPVDPFKSGDIIGVAVDLDAREVFFSKNGTWVGERAPNAESGFSFPQTIQSFSPAVRLPPGATARVNFGSHAFQSAPPTGFEAGWFQ